MKRHIWFNIIIGCIAATAGILFGYDTGVISGVILFAKQQFKLTSFSIGLVVGTVPLGALFGALVSGRVADQLGRRLLLIVTAIIFFIGTLGCTLSMNTSWLIISRFIVGLGIGISSYTAPLYISEIAPAHFRGALVSLNQLAITIGIVLAYWVNFSFSASGAWRDMFAVGLIPAVILLIGMLFLPDSPRWIVNRGMIDKARQILLNIRENRDVVEAEIQQIMTVSSRHNNWNLLVQPWVRPALLIGVSLAILQQITGINTIIYYAPTIFTLGGFENAQVALFATLGIGVVNVLATILSLPLIDRWGRRPLLLVGVLMMAVSLLVLSYVFYHVKGIHLHYLPLICMIAYIIGFAISLGPIAWLMIVEIFPLDIRGLGSSVATACNWGANMLVGLSFLTLIHTLSAAGTFLLFALISIATWIYIYYIIPETKETTLEMIEKNLRAGKSARYIGKT